MRLRCLTAAALLLAATPGVAAPVAEAALREAEREGRARVIVRLAAPALSGRESPGQRAARIGATERAADAALARIGGPAGRVLRRFGALPLLVVEASPRELAELAASPEVLAIEADRANFPSVGQSVPLVDGDLTESAGWDGTGSVVVVLDTGIEAGHAFLAGRVVAEACFSAGRDCPNGNTTQLGAGAAAPCTYGSQCFHGTHVAGIVAGRNEAGHGAAPGANLVAIQIGSETTGTTCGTAGSPCVTFYDSDIIAALDYVADTLSGTWNVAAVNLSLGTATTWASEALCDASNGAMKTALAAIRALEIAPVVASGNGSVTTGISSPACLSNAIAVGATLDNADSVWSKTNSGPPIDLWAPGTTIWSSMPGGAMANQNGTSMAAPHVAGAFAELRQADPAATVAELKATLESTGVPVTDSKNGLVRPRLDMDGAVRAWAPAACFDGLDNEGDGQVDIDGNNGGTPDSNCQNGFDTTESPPAPGWGCGVGPELLLALPLLARLRRRDGVRIFRLSDSPRGRNPKI